MSIDDQKVWTNSEVLRHRVMIEKELEKTERTGELRSNLLGSGDPKGN